MYIKDVQHRYENHPKEGDFTLVLIALSYPIARLFIETELDRQRYDWFYNELSDKYKIIKENKDVGYIKTITSAV